MKLNLNEWTERIHSWAIDNGFHPNDQTEDAYIESTCNNMHDEVSELHEAWRNNKLHEPCDKSDMMKRVRIEPLSCLEEELADIVIRAMDTAGRMKVDLNSVVTRKQAFNETRSYRHGNKRS
jgi:NTP pyrophosphatase (non-canonical NTP hydrolase)